MRQLLLAALVTVTALAATAAPARAGEVIKLAIELPPDAGVLAPGEEIPIQVVGLDAAGARVGFGGREVRIEATNGSVFVRRRPYLFRYQAPASVDAVRTVTISAELQEAPRIRGQVQIKVGPSGTYVRLVLRPRSATVTYGGSVDIDVLAETREGQLVPLRDRALKVDVRGPGRATEPGTGLVRYTAPEKRDARAGDEAVVVASVRRNGDIAGEIKLRLKAQAATAAPDPVQPGPDKPQPDTTPSAPPSGEQPQGIAWPGGNLRIATWRAWDLPDAGATGGDADTRRPRRRKMPAPGGDFVAPFDVQKLRIVVLRSDVTRTELEWWTGDRKGAKVERDGPGEKGPLRQTTSKQGSVVAHVELPVPVGDKALKALLRLMREDGSVIEERLVFRRGKDRDRDGKEDR